MCKYCNFDLSTHYLINGDFSLEDRFNATVEPNESLEELAVINIATTESNKLFYQLDEVFENEIEKEKEFLITKESNLIVLDNIELETNLTPQAIDSLPQISINDVEITDSSVGRELIFTISLNTISSETITVDYTTTDNSAIAIEDYIAVNGTVTFAPGETSKTITVNTTGTSYLDEDESFLVNLTNPVNAVIADGEGEGKIIPAYGGLRGWQRSQETITFSFFNEDVFGQGGYDGSLRESNAREPSEIVKNSYRQIFAHLNTIVDRNFVEVTETASEVGHIRIVVSDAPDYAYAGGHIHLADWAAASDAGINGWESVPGVYAYVALIHELGHALGMPHAFGKDSSLFDPEENSSNTVMSYTFPGNHPATFMAYDIKSLQERYGATEYRPEDTVYEFLTVDNYAVNGELAINTPSSLKQTIWDSGGVDTFDFSQLEFDASGYRFDLNQSKYQTSQTAYQGSSYTRNGTKYYVPKYGTSIAIDVDIENVVNSSSDDIIIGNPIGNTFSGYLPELTTGNDLLIGTDNLDTLDLSGFAFSQLNLTQINDDLQIDLGAGNFVTIEGYYGLAENERINILYKPEDVEIAVAPPTVSVEDIIVYEEDSNTNAKVTISLDKAIRDEFTVSYFTLDNTAIAGEDYLATNGTVIFYPGEISKTVNIPIIGDSLPENNESFLFSTGYGEGEITIGDDDSATLPEINIQDAAVLSSIPVRDSAGDIKNTTGLLFKITLDAPSNQTVKVDYATADGTAIAGEDYSAKNKTLIFQPGETEKQVFVGVTVDDLVEAHEELYLNLSNPVNAIIADNQAVGTIEETRSLSVSDVTINEDAREAIFTISLDRPSLHTVITSFSTVDGTAKAGVDYTPASGRFGILPGYQNVTIAIPLIDNKLTEGDETFFLNLSDPKYVLIDDFQGQATITDNDPIPTENPGGVYQNLHLWLKADRGITTENEQVTTWEDNSQLALDLGQSTAGSQPTLKANGLNYNPVLNFDGDDLLETIDTLPGDFVDNSSVFVVTKHNANNYNYLFTLDNTGSGRFLAHMPWGGNIYFDAGGTGNGRLSTSYTDSGAKEFNTWHFSSQTGVGQNIFRNGLSLASDNNTQSPITENRKFQLGRQYSGEIAEVIVFNQALGESDRLAVDSYLAIKYGFTLDQTSPTNYLNSQGEIIWDAVAGGNYNQDIAGIALDSASELSQVKSRSSNQDSMVTIGNASNLDNGEALIWSNNGGAINAESIAVNNGTYYLDRQWRVQETGEVGTLNLSFDLSGLGYITDDLEGYALLIDDDGDFSNATAVKTGLQLDGNEINFSNINLENGQYFTLAVPEKLAPGGIKSNLQLWLRGDSILTDNSNITQWRDHSGKNVDYTAEDSNNQPVLATEQFNFNPVVSFTGNDTLITSRTNFTQGEVFFVLKGQDNSGNSALLGDRNYYGNSNFKYEQWWNTGKLGFTRRGIADYTSNLPSPNNQLSLLSFNSDTDNTIVNLAVENNGILSQDSLDIGASNPIALEYLADGFKGDIAEVIVFDRVLNDTERLQLRSNLAIKYGLSLDLNANYINSDNQVWWYADLAGEYNNDVAGIARDDSADLAQVKSRSSNANSIITITAEDPLHGLEDGEALIWGNNNNTELSQRIWQVQENQGDVGILSISFDLSVLGEQQPLENYALQISNNDNFTNPQFHTIGRTIENNILTFTGIDFNHGEYFSLNTEYNSQAIRINGTDLDDTLVGQGDDEIINGGAGNDRLQGKAGNDTLNGGLGHDTIYEYTYGNLTLTDSQLMGRGSDTFTQIESARLDGNYQSNLIDASTVTQLNITLSGGSGNDTLLAGDLDDVLNGYHHQDNLNGGRGNDILYGGNGNDILIGANGDDFLDGGNHNDTLYGGNGNDILIGANGDDFLDGGEGIDKIVEYTYGNFTLTDTQLTGRGTDTFNQIESAYLKGNYQSNLIDASKVTQLNVTLSGGSGDDTLLAGNLDDVLSGYNQNDRLDGGDGNDTLYGGNGDDTLYGGNGNNILFGNSGIDVFVLQSNNGIANIRDFSDGTDLLGLTNNLDFNDLNIVANNNGVSIQNTSNAVIANLAGVSIAEITRDDFLKI